MTLAFYIRKTLTHLIMPIVKTIATGMLGRSAAKRLSRVIPNPALRYLAVAAATTLVPMIASRLRARAEARRLTKASESSMRFPSMAT
jgi:hypothetical protein